MGSKAPDPPNYQPMADASETSSQIMYDISAEDRDFAREQFEAGQATQQQYLGYLEQQLGVSSENAQAAAGASVSAAQAAAAPGMAMAQVYADGVDIQRDVAGVQMDQMHQNMEQGQDYYDNYVNTFRPVEQRVVDDTMAFNQNARFDELARDYQARHAQGLAGSRQAADMSSAARGVNPNSAASVAMREQQNIQAAGASAAGADAARRAARAEGQGRLMEAVGIGRNQPGYSTNAYSLATGAANSAINAGQGLTNAAYQQGSLANQAQANAISAQGNQLQHQLGMAGLQFEGIGMGLSAGNSMVTQGAGMFSQGASAAYQGGSLLQSGLGSILDSQTDIYNNQTNANAEMMGAIVGGATGMFSFPSDIRLKENIELVGQYPNGMNQYEFNYRDDASRQRYRGVMAQEVQETRPDAVVTDGEGYMSVIYDLLGVEMEKV